MLQLEALEDRRLLSIVTWDGGGDHSSWGDALNSDTNSLPGSSDVVVIPDLATTSAVTYSTGTITV